MMVSFRQKLRQVSRLEHRCARPNDRNRRAKLDGPRLCAVASLVEFSTTSGWSHSCLQVHSQMYLTKKRKFLFLIERVLVVLATLIGFWMMKTCVFATGVGHGTAGV